MHPEQPCTQLVSQVRCGFHDLKLSSTHMRQLQHTMPWATDSHGHQITNLYSLRGTLRPQTLLLPASQGGPKWRNDYVAEPSLLIQGTGPGNINTQIHLSLPCQGKRDTRSASRPPFPQATGLHACPGHGNGRH